MHAARPSVACLCFCMLHGTSSMHKAWTAILRWQETVPRFGLLAAYGSAVCDARGAGGGNVKEVAVSLAFIFRTGTA